MVGQKRTERTGKQNVNTGKRKRMEKSEEKVYKARQGNEDH